jgi:quercetin dioxygenase-like cupin family protein
MDAPRPTLTSPFHERLVFRQTAAETGGARLEIEATFTPRETPPPAHAHPRQTETFDVLDGTLRVRIDGRERDYGAGERFVVPPGTPHTMRAVGDAPARAVWTIEPALGTQTFFETLWGLARDGETDRNGVPNLLQAAVALRAYRHEFRLTSPPAWVQRVAFGVLAPVGRLLGYRARYARYSPSHA